MLAYNREIKKAFFIVCADLATESEKKRSPFANETLGFSNWKKGMEKLKEHDASELIKKWMKKTYVGRKCHTSFIILIITM